MLQRLFSALITLTLSLTLASCIKPYKAPVQQGNILTTKSITAIHTGMTTQQVTQVLGKPVLTNLYKNNHLIYVYTYQSKNSANLSKKQVIISFKNNRVMNIQNTSQP